MAKKKTYTNEELLAQFDNAGVPLEGVPDSSVERVELDEAGLPLEGVQGSSVEKVELDNAGLPLKGVEGSSVQKEDISNNQELLDLLNAPQETPVQKNQDLLNVLDTPQTPPVEATPPAVETPSTPAPDGSGDLMAQYTQGLLDGTIPQNMSPKAWIDSHGSGTPKPKEDMRGLRTKGLDMEADAVDAAVAQGRDLAKMNVSYYEYLANAEKYKEERDRLIQENANRMRDDFINQIQNDQKELMNNPKNVRALFDKSGIGGKIGLAIGTMLGGMYQGMNKMSSNPFVDSIEKWIEGDRAQLQDNIAIARANQAENVLDLERKLLASDRERLSKLNAADIEMKKQGEKYKAQNGYIPPEFLAAQAKIQQSRDTLYNSMVERQSQAAAEMAKAMVNKQLENQAKKEEILLKGSIDSQLQREKGLVDNNSQLRKLSTEKAFKEESYDEAEKRLGLVAPDKYRDMNEKEPASSRFVPLLKKTAPTRDVAQKINEDFAKAIVLKSSVKEIMRIFDKYGTDWNKMNNEEEAYANSLIDQIRGVNRTDLVGPGAITDEEWKMLRDILPNIGNVFSINKNTIAKFKAFQDKSDATFNAKLKSFGFEDKWDAGMKESDFGMKNQTKFSGDKW